jgi:hypothetical protein
LDVIPSNKLIVYLLSRRIAATMRLSYLLVLVGLATALPVQLKSRDIGWVIGGDRDSKRDIIWNEDGPRVTRHDPDRTRVTRDDPDGTRVTRASV